MVRMRKRSIRDFVERRTELVFMRKSATMMSTQMITVLSSVAWPCYRGESCRGGLTITRQSRHDPNDLQAFAHANELLEPSFDRNQVRARGIVVEARLAKAVDVERHAREEADVRGEHDGDSDAPGAAPEGVRPQAEEDLGEVRREGRDEERGDEAYLR